MKYFLFFLLLLIFSTPSLLSETTVIRGIAKNAEGQSVRIITYLDQISYIEKTIARTIIGTEGKFDIQLDLDHTIFAFIDIGFQKGEIYLEPGKNYLINVEFDPDRSYFGSAEQSRIELEILSPSGNELNQKIRQFNEMYNNFMTENFTSAYSRISKAKAEEFISLIKAEFTVQEHPYFKNYVRYKLASFEQFAILKSKLSLAETYFLNQPILYENVEYMYFFNQFFSQFFLINSNIIPNEELLSLVNDTKDHYLIFETLARFSYLANDQLRELVLLKTLNDLYFTTGFDKLNILQFLRQISKQSKYTPNRKIADNLIRLLTRFSKGSPAPDITLIDKDNEKVLLKDLVASPVYLVFYKSGNLSCIAEMDLLKKIEKEFEDKIDFISISADPSVDELLKLKQQRNYNWVFLHYNNNPEIFERFGIRSFPVFIMLDKNYQFLDYSAPAPSENLKNYLYQWAKKQE